MAAAVIDPAGIWSTSGASTTPRTRAGDCDRQGPPAALSRADEDLQDSVERGGVGLRDGAPGAMPVEGGVPLVLDGRIVRRARRLGRHAEQDSQCAKPRLTM